MFSIAITAWSANVLINATCRSSKRSLLGRAVPTAPITWFSRIMGAKMTKSNPNSRAARRVVCRRCGIGEYRRELHDLLRQHGESAA